MRQSGLPGTMNLTAIFSMITFLLSFYMRPELHVKSAKCLEQDTERSYSGGRGGGGENIAVGQDSKHQGGGILRSREES